jgi:hypothetical protein
MKAKYDDKTPKQYIEDVLFYLEEKEE